MKPLEIFSQKILLVVFVFLSTSCSATNSKSEINLTGSTPGDQPIKTLLKIPAETKVDFIRWNLLLNDKNAFVLDINYGESQPNTLGFKKNGKMKTFKGSFSVSEVGNFKEVYRLKSSGFLSEILMVKLNDNIFHLLTSQNQMTPGNGGWSYSLNRAEPVKNDEISLSSYTNENKSTPLVYEGRTPCKEMADEHPEMKASSSCFKIKWKMTLNRDSVTNKPSTCSIRNIADNHPRDIIGTWEIVKGTPKNPTAIIYKIKVDNLSDPILLFAADDNALFFLDKNYEPMIGNKDFSFTMNRIIKK